MLAWHPLDHCHCCIPSSFVAKTVAFAFGLATSSFFPALIMGIFSKRINKEGAIAGMISELASPLAAFVYFQFLTRKQRLLVWNIT